MSIFQDNSRKSDLACHSCRRRKVKCDRVVPQCMVCEQTSQVCRYPAGPLKPGPKIGSSQRQRKRRRESCDIDDGDLEGGSIQSYGQNTRSPESITSNGNLHPSCDKASSFMGTLQQSSGSAQMDQRNTNKHESRLGFYDLSFILHPSHESSGPEKQRVVHPRVPMSDQYGLSRLDRAIEALGVTQTCLDQMIKVYFDNMVGINLFHEPTFMNKISTIESTTEVNALLAAMFAFASRFYQPTEDSSAHHIGPSNVPDTHRNAAHFLGLASSYTDEALKDCGDEPPPLCILQAFIITAHCQLTQGVLGTSWRSLGTCVRLAYELNLHLIDMRGADSSREADAKTWCEDEEKRRAWWAIWEMDVFATTIRRTPTAIDWSQTETMLPAEDEYWYQGQVRPSCYLEMDPISRWRALRNSGNQSPKAWYIVINSLMKEAQKISSPHGVPSQYQPSDGQLPRATPLEQDQSAVTEHARQKLESLANAVQCFVLALPAHLRYRNQYLGFHARAPGQLVSDRQLDCSVYNIHVMTQLTRLMIHRYNVFGSHARLSPRQTRQTSNASAQKESNTQNTSLDDMAMRQYFEASDNIITIVNRSCDDHIQYINPFLSFTIWLASAVQLVHRGFCRPGTNQSLVKSKFEVLNLTYKRCVEFWDIKAAVQQNLETLEAQLEACQVRNRSARPTRGPAASGVGKATAGPHPGEKSKDMSTSRDTCKEPRGLDLQSGPADAQSNIKNDNSELRWRSASANLPTPPSIGSAAAQGEALQAYPPDISALGSIYLSTHQADAQPPTAGPMQTPPSPLMDPLLPLDATQASAFPFDDFSAGAPEMYDDWRCSEVFTDIQNLLSGYPAYGVLGGS